MPDRLHILVAADKFKGSLTAREVCESVANGVHSVHKDAKVTQLPMADGGEGSLEVLTDVLGMTQKEVKVRDPLFRAISAKYGMQGASAYIEMARSSGLQLLQQEERSARSTSTLGVGDLMKDALKQGAKQIYLFVGGSATNDGGTGMLQGLGYQLLDHTGNEVQATGENLSKIAQIITPPQLPPFELVIVTDVQNKLLGPEGASFHYGQQKGATDHDLQMLEVGLAHFSKLVSELAGFDVSAVPGSGAAGGIAVAGLGILGGEINKGIDTFLKITDFHTHVKQSDLVITGEGKLDSQTLQGKVVDGVARAAEAEGKRVVVVCGVSEVQLDQLKALGISTILPLKTPDISTAHCMQYAGSLIEQRVKSYFSESNLPK